MNAPFGGKCWESGGGGGAYTCALACVCSFRPHFKHSAAHTLSSISREWKSSRIFHRTQADRNYCKKRQRRGLKMPPPLQTRHQIYYFTYKSFDVNTKSPDCRPESRLRGLKRTQANVCQEWSAGCRDTQEALTQLANTSEHTPFIKYRFPLSH